MLIYLIFVFIFGCIIGSFLNVCISRIPNKESVLFGRSRCPKCRVTIKFYDNIPILSFIFLRGRCRSCKSRISHRYWIVELLTGIAFSLLALKYYQMPHYLIKLWILCGYLICITFIDAKYYIIPDKLTYPAGFVALVYSLVTKTPLAALICGLVGFGFFYILRLVGFIILRREGLGWGDVKLAATIGLYLINIWQLMLALFFSAALGTITAVVLICLGRLKRRQPLPFAPFICCGTILTLLVDWKKFIQIPTNV